MLDWRWNPMLEPTQAMIEVAEAAKDAAFRRPEGIEYDCINVIGSQRIHADQLMVTFGGGTVRFFLCRKGYLYRLTDPEANKARLLRLAEYNESQLRTIREALEQMTFPVDQGLED